MDRPDQVIRNGRVVDAATGRDGVADVVVKDGMIVDIGSAHVPQGTPMIDATGWVVAPGLIDIHVHLREPGFEEKETIASGTAAAAAGGFTTIFCMPNTNPALDSVESLLDLRRRVEQQAHVRVHPIATITRGRQGTTPVDFDALVSAGAVGFSDDGDTTANSAIMRQALAASARLDRPVMVHCEDAALASGAMHEGAVSAELGVAGIPAEAEEIIIGRDIMLARLTNGWLHVCHVSTGRGVDLIRRAKHDGVAVTAEVMPHHLLMSDEWVQGDRTLLNVDECAGSRAAAGDPLTKVNPPLRPPADTRRLLAALQEGTFDLVATDHAPHAAPEKAGSSFEAAAFGMNGLEFALPLMLGLVRAGQVTLSQVVGWLSERPARLWGLPGGSLRRGAPADLVAFDPHERWVVAAESLRTKNANTPLLGMELQGKAKLTMVGGEVKYVG